MAEKVSRRLSYEPTPNMAGLYAEDIPAAPAPTPTTVQPEPQPYTPPPAPSPPSYTATWQGPVTVPAAPAPTAPPYREPARPAVPAAPARARKAPAKPPAPPRPARSSVGRSQSVVSSEARVRRTIRIPLSFDKKLRELAAARGVNLNSAILAAIDVDWQSMVAGRRRS